MFQPQIDRYGSLEKQFYMNHGSKKVFLQFHNSFITFDPPSSEIFKVEIEPKKKLLK